MITHHNFRQKMYLEHYFKKGETHLQMFIKTEENLNIGFLKQFSLIYLLFIKFTLKNSLNILSFNEIK